MSPLAPTAPTAPIVPKALLLAASLALCLPTGCDEQRGSQEVFDPVAAAIESAPPIEAADFCGRYLGAVCSRRINCRQFGKIPTPYDPCEDWVIALQPDCEAHWGALAAAGMATFSRAEAGRCVTLVKESRCGDVFDNPDFIHDCVRRTIKGVAGEGDACHADLGCQEGLRCDLTACPGRCVPAAERLPVGVLEGGACGQDVGQCRFGLQCSTGRCVEPARLGFACGQGIGPCEEYRGWCQPVEGRDGGVCAELPGPGEECGLGKGERCQRSTCDPASGFCITPPRGPGDPCDSRYPDVCDSWSCNDADRCDPIGWPFPACPVPGAGE